MNPSPTNAFRPFEPLNTCTPNAHPDDEAHSQKKIAPMKAQLGKTTPTTGPRTPVEVNLEHVECRDENESFQLSPIGRMEFSTPSFNTSQDGKGRDLSFLQISPMARNGGASDCDSANTSFPEPDGSDEVEINSAEFAEEQETDGERLQREIEESEALARQLMAEEAMASYALSSEYLHDNADQFSSEDLAALQAAMAEENMDGAGEEEGEEFDGDQELSYDALLRLGEQIGDVKEERWARIAHEKIQKIPTLSFDPSMAEGKDENHTEVKCLICQFPYEDQDELRRLPCQHCFHKDCVDSWLQTKDTCALCRKSIVP